MPLIRRGGVTLPLEHMAQMPPTIMTDNFRPHHAEHAVFVAVHGPWDAVEVGGPAAAALEFVVGGVEGRVAGGAVVGAFRRHVFVVFARVRRFGALFADHTELRRGEDGAPFAVGLRDGVGAAGGGGAAVAAHVVFGGSAAAEETAEQGDRRQGVEFYPAT